jgi:hypothetical protein
MVEGMTTTAQTAEQLEGLDGTSEPAEAHAEGRGLAKLEETLGGDLAGRLVTALSTRGAADKSSRA